MHQIRVEVNGKEQNITLDQLKMLTSRKFVSSDARVWIDDKEFSMRDVMSKLSSSSEEKKNAVSPLPSAERLRKPRVENSVENKEDDDDFFVLPSSQNYKEKPKSSKWKRFLVFFFVIIGVVGVGVGGVWLFLHANGLEDDFAETYNAVTGNKQKIFTEDDPFDRTLIEIPKNFNGNNFEKLLEKIKEQNDQLKIISEKKNFETEKEYYARMENEIMRSNERVILGNIHFGEDVSFLISRDDSVTDSKGKKWSFISLDSKYNNDEKSWFLKIRFPAGIYCIDGVTCVPLFTRTDSEVYSAQDESHASWDVNKEFDYNLNLFDFDHEEGMDDIRNMNRKVLSFLLTNVPAEIAENATDNLAALCVFKPIPLAVLETHAVSNKATFDYPHEYEIIGQFLKCRAIEFWFFDRKTGEIFVKARLNDLIKYPIMDFQKAQMGVITGSRDIFDDDSEDEEKRKEKFDNLDKDEEAIADKSTEKNSVATDSKSPSDATQKKSGNEVKSQSSAKSAANEPASKYATKPFDDKVNRLPTDYMGHDPSAIVRGLTTRDFSTSKISYARDSQQYLAAVIKQATYLQDKTLFGSVRFDSRVAYVFPNQSENTNPKVETVQCEYDSSRKVLTIKRSFKIPELKASSMDEGSYPPMAAYFGLLEQHDDVYALALKFNQIKKKTASQLDHWTVVGVEPEQYAQFKDSLRLACVFNIGAGGNNYIGYFRPQSGRLISPYYLICAASPEFWLFDAKTGEVLAKYSAADTFNGKRVKIGDVD